MNFLQVFSHAVACPAYIRSDRFNLFGDSIDEFGIDNIHGMLWNLGVDGLSNDRRHWAARLLGNRLQPRRCCGLIHNDFLSIFQHGQLGSLHDRFVQMIQGI